MSKNLQFHLDFRGHHYPVYMGPDAEYNHKTWRKGPSSYTLEFHVQDDADPELAKAAADLLFQTYKDMKTLLNLEDES